MDNIFDNKDAARTLASLEKKRESLEDSIRDAEKNLSRLLYNYERERKDVDNLKKDSFSSFVLKLVGKYDNKLSEEIKEELQAKQIYDQAENRLKTLKEDLAGIGRQMPELRKKAERLNVELDNRRAMLAEQNSEIGEEFRALEKSRDDLVSQQTETREALEAAKRAFATAKRALESFNKADDWATYDIWFDKGFIFHHEKYSNIDDAEASFYLLKSQMKALEKELGDIGGSHSMTISEISFSERAVDLWFDNIFTDLMVRDKIRGNISELRSLTDSLSKVIRKLEEMLSRLQRRLEENSVKQEEILLNLS